MAASTSYSHPPRPRQLARLVVRHGRDRRGPLHQRDLLRFLAEAQLVDHVRHVVHDDRPALRDARLAPEAAEDRGDEEVALLVDPEGVVEARRAPDQRRAASSPARRPARPRRHRGPSPPPSFPRAAPVPRLPLAVSRPDEEEVRPRPRVEDRDRLRLAESRQVEEVGVGAVAVGRVPARGAARAWRRGSPPPPSRGRRTARGGGRRGRSLRCDMAKVYLRGA